MPTVLEICDIPPEAPYGRSWLPVLRGETEHHWEHIFSSYFSWEGEGRIQYLKSLITVTTQDWSLVVGPPPYEPQLFDRRTEPKQEHNCAAEKPYVVEQLSRVLIDFMGGRGADPEYVRAFVQGSAGY